ncbi:MAG: DNA gyrase inhibitor YacG [Ideonella sp.]|nr:DNA gyrase inhibitor YacG [Ideonella sp.]
MSAAQPAPRQLEVSCPVCARRTIYSEANRWRPFCSERCRTVDLGAWASEQFRVVEASAPEESPGFAPPPIADHR